MSNLGDVLRIEIEENLTDDEVNEALDVSQNDFPQFAIDTRDKLLAAESGSQAEIQYRKLTLLLSNQHIFSSNLLELFRTQHSKLILDVLLADPEIERIPHSEVITKATLVELMSLVTKIRGVQERLKQRIKNWWPDEVRRPHIIRKSERTAEGMATVVRVEERNKILNKRLTSEYCSFLVRRQFSQSSREKVRYTDQIDFMLLLAYEQMRALVVDRAMKPDDKLGLSEVPLELRDHYSIILQFGSFRKKVLISKAAITAGSFVQFYKEVGRQLNIAGTRTALRINNVEEKDAKLKDEMRKLGFANGAIEEQGLASIEKYFKSNNAYSPDVRRQILDEGNLEAADLKIGYVSTKEAILIEKIKQNVNWMTNGGRIKKVVVINDDMSGVITNQYHPDQDGVSGNDEIAGVLKRVFENHIILNRRENNVGPKFAISPTAKNEFVNYQKLFRADIDGNDLIRDVLEDQGLHNLYKKNFGIKLSITQILTLLGMITTGSTDAHYLESHAETGQLIPTLMMLPDKLHSKIIEREKGDTIEASDFYYFLTLLNCHQHSRNYVREVGVSEVSAMALMTDGYRKLASMLASAQGSLIPDLLEHSLLVSTPVATTKKKPEESQEKDPISYQREFTSAPADQYGSPLGKGSFSVADAGNGRLNIIHLVDKENEMTYKNDLEFGINITENLTKIMDFLIDGAEQFSQKNN